MEADFERLRRRDVSLPEGSKEASPSPSPLRVHTVHTSFHGKDKGRYDLPTSSAGLRAHPHTVHEKVLISGLVDAIVRNNPRGNAKTIAYSIGEGGTRAHSDLSSTQAERDELKRIYRETPEKIMSVLRENLFAVAQDPRASAVERKARLSEYFDAAAILTIRLDDYAFPPQDQATPAIRGSLRYIPDGYLDIAGHSICRVNKSVDLAKAKGILCSTIWEITERNIEPSSEEAKHLIIGNVANWLYHNFPGTLSSSTGESPYSTRGDSLVGAGNVALLGKILFQQFAMRTCLFRNTLTINDRSTPHHSADLVRVKGIWHLLDIACPDGDFVFLRPLPGGDRTRKNPEMFYPYQFKDKAGTLQRNYTKDESVQYRIVAREALIGLEG